MNPKTERGGASAVSCKECARLRALVSSLSHDALLSIELRAKNDELRGEIARYQACGDFETRGILEILLISGVEPAWMLQEIQSIQREMEQRKAQQSKQ